MPSRYVTLAVSLVALACAHPAPSAGTPENAAVNTVVINDADRPRLVVMMVVDQFREPYLERYGDLFTGGFRRLLDQGRTFTNATHDHAITETAVGHATLSTAVYPMRHGIVANEWVERTKTGWVDVSNVGDSTKQIVGAPGLAGVSPHYLMRPGLADWISAANPRSQVASVSAKDRGAVLPAAHAKGQVYWFEPRAGRFVTSTYYRDRYPAWADEFTQRVLPTFMRDSVWESSIPAAALGRSAGDTAAYEGDGVHMTFPHRFADEARPGQFWAWFATTPMLDAATLEYAKTMINALGLGSDDAPDFLNVSLSQTDRVGHAYGPLSREQLDNLLRLDRALGEFFAFLDTTVGNGKWAVGLSADHGSLLAPETLPQPGESAAGRRMTREERAALTKIARRSDTLLVRGDTSLVTQIRRSLTALPFVAAVYPHSTLLRQSGTPADSFAVLERRSIFPGRAGGEFSVYGVEVRFVEGWLARMTGTTHGTPYWYDRHVPLMFFGPGVKAGRDSARAATVDFAPTLATWIGVKPTSAIDGRVLTSVFGPSSSRSR
jgi:predicted AlkP superfamily pyrophosphatase or phosphodiesterase